MRPRAIVLVIGLALVAAALVVALWPFVSAIGRADASLQEPRRRLQIDASPSDSSLHLRFTRTNGAVGDLHFVRGPDGATWVPQAQVDAPGVVLGDGYPVFATPRFLAVHAIDPRQALRPMSPEIAREEADEVTVIRGWGGEVAICLWQHDKIVRVYLAGGVFDALRSAEQHTSHRATACETLEALALTAPAGATRTAAWAATLAGCSTRRAAALEALHSDCENGEATACDLLLARSGDASDLWPEIDDFWRWTLDLIDAVRADGAGDSLMPSPPSVPR